METKSGRLELPDVWNNAAKQVAIGSSFTSDPIRRSINQPLDAMKGSPSKTKLHSILFWTWSHVFKEYTKFS